MSERTEFAGAAFVLGLNLGLQMDDCGFDPDSGECSREDCPVGE